MPKLTYLWYLLWLIPLYMLIMAFHLGAVYYGLEKTYEQGQSYIAEVDHFEIKQIAAQTNGSITLRFTPTSGTEIVRKLSQPIQNAAQLQNADVMPIRYYADSYQPIVIIPIYEFHKLMVIMNLAVVAVSLLITMFIAVVAHRFAGRKLTEKRLKKPEQTFEIVDS